MSVLRTARLAIRRLYKGCGEPDERIAAMEVQIPAEKRDIADKGMPVLWEVHFVLWILLDAFPSRGS